MAKRFPHQERTQKNQLKNANETLACALPKLTLQSRLQRTRNYRALPPKGASNSQASSKLGQRKQHLHSNKTKMPTSLHLSPPPERASGIEKKIGRDSLSNFFVREPRAPRVCLIAHLEERTESAPLERPVDAAPPPVVRRAPTDERTDGDRSYSRKLCKPQTPPSTIQKHRCIRSSSNIDPTRLV